MDNALKKTGRDILYSVCNWGEENVSQWAPEIANSWRTTQDIIDVWSSVEYLFHVNAELRERSKPGAWNDPDMLEVGNGGLT